MYSIKIGNFYLNPFQYNQYSRNKWEYIPGEAQILPSTNVEIESGVHPAPYPMGTGVKQQKHEADHSLLPSAKVKNV
jgi:hypothetical protein